MTDHRFAYPSVREIRPVAAPDGSQRFVRPQRTLVEASLLRRPLDERR